MRRKDKEIDDILLIEQILATAQVCRLAMSLNDEPYVVPMNFGYKDRGLYFHCAREGKKIDILKRNNRVCFEVETHTGIIKSGKPCNWGMKYMSVIGYGKVSFINDSNEKIEALKIILNQYYKGEFDFTDADIDKIDVFKVDIESMTGKKSGY